jgi:hypothetical protein
LRHHFSAPVFSNPYPRLHCTQAETDGSNPQHFSPDFTQGSHNCPCAEAGDVKTVDTKNMLPATKRTKHIRDILPSK